MVKHTPGPWKVQEFNYMGVLHYNVVHSYGSYPVGLAHTTLYCDKGCKPNHDLERANAYLIAAAPELLRALEMLVERTDFDPVRNMDGVYPALDLAKRTIAKAKGEA
jgi:hypothetical protein